MRNDSRSNQSRRAVLGIDAPIIDATANDNEFKNRVALSCVTPAADTHEGKFVILAEPIAARKIGRADAAGVCPVQIIVLDEDAEAYQFAVIFGAYAIGLYPGDDAVRSPPISRRTGGCRWRGESVSDLAGRSPVTQEPLRADLSAPQATSSSLSSQSMYCGGLSPVFCVTLEERPRGTLSWIANTVT